MYSYLVLLCALGAVLGQPGSPMWEYVHRDDGYYSYSEITEYDLVGVTSYVINMTSQRWMDDDWATPSVWYHYVTVHIPDNLDPAAVNHALLYIGTGSWDDNPPDPNSRHIEETASFANNTGIVSAVIKQIPFQPIVFNGTTLERSEDTIIAWTWANYLESDNTALPETLLRFPMCKAVSKAMDAIITVAAEKTGGASAIQKYMIAGESKRGWTTWLMPAADDRVEAIVPVVLSCLNLNTNMHHYWRSMGNWTFMFTDYWVERIPEWMDHPNIFPMLELIDPYYYRDILTMPKLMVSGAMDEFFMPDDYDYFFDDLLGEKHMWLMENTGHEIDEGPLYADFWVMMESYYISIIKNRPRPSVTWTKNVDPTTGAAYIQVTTGEPAESVVALVANTTDLVEDRRDFRRIMLGGDGSGGVETGMQYYQFNTTDMGGNTWRFDLEKPDKGYTVFFLKLKFPYPEEGNRFFMFTTQAVILTYDPPNVFPFEDCTLKDCQGFLV